MWKVQLTRAIRPGHGVTLQRLDVPHMGGLGDAREAHLLQLLVDPNSGLVGPADHGKPAQDARESDERRHRSILV
ncbi:hypothetical protein BJA5080_01090 [Bradyrhizobium diazoefficiens SEMIA 5080]|uniref:Uncharacterized protein n=1 Tax=Bradyrhizobium diazoefficiens SEMIA 5080 TaxID=754504 RepID=A0A837CFG7_9BRAD|nr:hypothetical protein BJA5080_01090 [Bradyrhizobium diazoefficiens SEMIA 5080]